MKLNFMKHKYLYFLISLLFLAPSIFSLIFWGLKPAIDFTGGSIIEIKNNSIKIKDNKAEIEEIIKLQQSELASIQESGKNSYILRTKEIDKNQKQRVLQALEAKYGQTEEIRFETVGPTIGKE